MSQSLSTWVSVLCQMYALLCSIRTALSGVQRQVQSELACKERGRLHIRERST